MMMMMIDRVVTVIGLLDFWDVSRGEVETYSIWKDRLSFLIPRIEADSGFADLDFTETPLQGMIQIVVSVPSGISAWGSKRGGCRLGTLVR
jgi:hypothetical protein